MSKKKSRYFLIYKPFGMMSQFSKEGDKLTLADLNFTFPKDIYPVGRLDADSEGLLLLSNDKALNQQFLHPKNAHQRTYWAQVEGIPTDEALSQLKKGVTIRVNKKDHHTLPAKASLLPNPDVPPRTPPIRFRKSVPDSWIALTLTEGKNRQVRKMTAAVGHPTLRLIRYQMGEVTIGNLEPGGVIELSQHVIHKKLLGNRQ